MVSTVKIYSLKVEEHMEVVLFAFWVLYSPPQKTLYCFAYIKNVLVKEVKI